jgi:microcin C transport system substrate-binding protein
MRQLTYRGIFGRAMALTLMLGAVPVAAQDAPTTVAHGISTFGDLALPADFTHLPYVNPDAPKGGEMSQWAMGGFDSMNPFSIKGRAAARASAPLETLLEGTADEIGASYCLLCETLEYPADRSWVIFTLREGITFSDGSPLTAEDVAFSTEIFRTKGLADFRKILNDKVASVEVLDARRIKYTFKPGIPTRDLPQDMGGIPVLSKAHYAANNLDLEESTLVPLLGSGPYMPDKVAPPNVITWKRNPDYWGRDIPMMRGRSNFDHIRIEYFADGTAAFEAFKSGIYTFRNENSSKQWANGYDFGALTKGHVIKTELPSGTKANGQSYMFNLRREKFQDIRVRQAIGLMFNYEWSNQTLFFGLYARINSVWENAVLKVAGKDTLLAATGLPGADEVAILQPLVEEGLLSASILTDAAVMAPVSGSRQLDRGGLRAASDLLDQAGWAVGSDGLRRDAKGEVFKIEFLSDDPGFERVNLPFIENLKALGIDASLNTVDSAQYEDRVRPPKYDFDIVTDRAAAGYFSGSELLQYYGSETADVSSFNMAGLKSPAVDRLIKVVMAAQTKEELVSATRALDRALRAERFWVPQWYKDKHTVAFYDQYGYPETLPPFALGELDFWWFDADKAAKLIAAGALK